MGKQKDFKNEESKGKKPYRGRKPHSSSRKPKEAKEDGVVVSGNVNDPSYYYEDANMLSQVTNFTFEQFLGVPINLGRQINIDLKYNVSNIMTVWLNPSVQPTTDDMYSSIYGVNIAATKNYLYLSANNAKTTNYGPQDPMALLLAERSVIEMYSFIKRAFGVAYLYNTRNREYPTKLLNDMRIDADDFRKNLAAYRIRFNTDIALFDRIPFPVGVPMLKKAEEMYANVYLDEASPMAQTYMFCPYSVWQINETYNPQGIGLDTIQVYSNNLEQLDYFLSIFEALIAALANSSLLNYVYSDILRVCGDKLFKLDLVPENYGIMPAVNNETRIWLHNMLIVGAPPLALDDVPAGYTTGITGLNDVETNTNGDGLNYHPMFRLANSQWKMAYEVYANALVDFETINPSIDEKVAATRLAFRSEVTSLADAGGNVAIYTTGLPVLGDYYAVYCLIDDGVGTSGHVSVYGGIDTMNTTTLAAIIKRLSKVDQFNFAPLVYLGRDTAIDGTNFLSDIHGDINYYTNLDVDYMRSMRDAEMIAELGFRM